MPHLTIHFSENLGSVVDMDALCESLRNVLVEQGAYPVGGIRVRAIPVRHQAVADGHAENAFFDMVFRIAPGRSPAIKQATGSDLMKVAETALGDVLARPHLAISLEIVEIEKDYSWKTNSIHPRLAAERE